MSKGCVTILPPTLRIIQLFLKSIYYDFIDSLDLFIPLGVNRGGIFIRNSQVTTVSLEGLIIKLQAIVRDKGMRDPESSYNIFHINLLASTSLMLANGSTSTHLVK